MIGRLEREHVRHLVPERRAPVKIVVRAPGRAVHRDEIAESHAQQSDARQARRAHGEVVVLGIELDDDGLGELEVVAFRERSNAVVDEVLHVSLEHVGLVAVQAQDHAGAGIRLVHLRHLHDVAEVVEAVDESQRVDDLRTERIASISGLEVCHGFGDAIHSQ